jgi:crossover junction endodeoxyribonuclease RuvC
MRELCGPKYEVVIGIDPGFDGGLSFMTMDQSVVYSQPMPCIGKKGSKRELDAKAIADWLEFRIYQHYLPRLCVIEQVHAMPKQGVTSMFTFGMGYGTLLGILTALDMPTAKINPTTWKKEVLVGTKKDKTAAVAYCRGRYPSVNLIPEGHRTPHDGMADSLCLAEYAYRLVKDEKDLVINEPIQETDGRGDGGCGLEAQGPDDELARSLRLDLGGS